jgi:hypothetical protein
LVRVPHFGNEFILSWLKYKLILLIFYQITVS